MLIDILELFGLPALLSASVIISVKLFITERKKNAVMKDAMQSLMLSQLIQSYEYWFPKKYAPLYARQNFEMMFKNYKSLGGDGFADDIHEKFISLQIEKPKSDKKKV